MPVAFPAIPSDIQIGSAAAAENSRVEFQPGIGPPITRRRTSLSQNTYNVVFEPWTAAELATWESWYEDNLGAGALDFTLTDPLTNVSAVWVFAADQTYQVTLLANGRFQVSTQLLRLRDA